MKKRPERGQNVFTKVKEELEFILAVMKVLEYWQEKAVFEREGRRIDRRGSTPLFILWVNACRSRAVGTHSHCKVCGWLTFYRTETILKTVWCRC